MPTLMTRSRPNLRGRIILRRLFDAAQQPTEPHQDGGWRVDASHDRTDGTNKPAIHVGQVAAEPEDVG